MAKLDCGHDVDATRGLGIGTGVCVTVDERRICYNCADDAERESMREGRPALAYLSSDGRNVTTWPGGILGTVTRETVRTMYGFCRSERTFVRVTAFDGSAWHGSGIGRGCYVRLRKCV